MDVRQLAELLQKKSREQTEGGKMGGQTRGFCKYCGKEYTRGGMLRHLNACTERKKALAAETGKRRCGYYELLLAGRYDRDYWLIIEIRETATLRDLDQFIRDIWVECCGHLSEFNICGERYEAFPDEGLFWDEPAMSMDVKLSSIFSPGMEFTYEYDFGSTTELTVKVQDYRTGVWKKDEVTILSRNNPPEILCSVCGNKPAKWVNPEVVYGGYPFLCEECANKDDADGESAENEYEEEWTEEAFFLPVCNSPRMGICGYEGSEKYPDQFVPDGKR